MNSRQSALGAAVTAIALISGCAGEGTGLDEYGKPLGPSAVVLAPTFTSVQDNIFTPICTRCHSGASAPLGLVLDASVSRANLVGVPSVGLPTVLRVNPTLPDSSYLVWKIEGRTTIVGERMPLGLAPLSSEEVAAIRDWIEDGALEN